MAARSVACTDFHRSTTALAGSNPTQGTGISFLRRPVLMSKQPPDDKTHGVLHVYMPGSKTHKMGGPGQQ